MKYQTFRETNIARGLALEVVRRPNAGILVLSGDDLALVSGGDTRVSSTTTDSTLNRATAMNRAADAEDAYLRS